MDDLEDFVMRRTPSADRPLLGMTVLVVEDSRFACEAIRLLCLRSGARIRRADALASARRHLRVYRPSVVIVDMGLPDGSGTELIAELAEAPARVPVLLGTSGSDNLAEDAMSAGADGFLVKPVETLSVFQEAILRHLPREAQPTGPRALSQEVLEPDDMALMDDLSHVGDLLDKKSDEKTLDYVAQFLGGVARSARDKKLGLIVRTLADHRASGTDTAKDVKALRALLKDRLGRAAIV